MAGKLKHRWSVGHNYLSGITLGPRADVGGIMSHPTENTIEAVSFNFTRTQWQVLDRDDRPRPLLARGVHRCRRRCRQRPQ